MNVLRRPRFVSLSPSAQENKKERDRNDHGPLHDGARPVGSCRGIAEFSIFAVMFTLPVRCRTGDKRQHNRLLLSHQTTARSFIAALSLGSDLLRHHARFDCPCGLDVVHLDP